MSQPGYRKGEEAAPGTPQARLLSEIKASVELLNLLRENENLINQVGEASEHTRAALGSGKKMLIAGNGGSAADAQHLAGEIVGRLNFNRPGLPAMALAADSAIMTALGNDYGYEEVFARQIEALGQPGDVFWAFSTSGKSKNVLRALRIAKERGIYSIGFTGAGGGDMLYVCDLCLCIPSENTPKIQEATMLIGHAICAWVEEAIFKDYRRG